MYGRTGELKRLNNDRNNYSLPKFVRQQASKAHATITKQIKDKKLMRMRLRLIKAVKAQDENEASKIEQLMRFYLRQDRETGL